MFLFSCGFWDDDMASVDLSDVISSSGANTLLFGPLSQRGHHTKYTFQCLQLLKNKLGRIQASNDPRIMCSLSVILVNIILL